jgi:hypothetical protein
VSLDHWVSVAKSLSRVNPLSKITEIVILSDYTTMSTYEHASNINEIVCVMCCEIMT